MKLELFKLKKEHEKDKIISEMNTKLEACSGKINLTESCIVLIEEMNENCKTK